MRVLLTGATGFIGSHTAAKLVEAGHTVIGTGVDAEHPARSFRLLTPSLIGINWSEIKNIDAVIHLAANNDTTSTDEDEMFHANVEAPKELFKRCFDNGCRRFVYASSASVYGHLPAPQKEDGPTNPLNAYARSKLAFESFAMEFATNGSSVTGLRYFNVYGPGEQHKRSRASMVYQMACKAKAGHRIKLFRYGQQKRDWVHVSDVVAYNILAMNLPGCNILNVGTGESRSFHEIMYCLNQAGHTPVIEFVPNPHEENYQAHTCACMKKAENLFGSRPFVSLREGVKQLLSTELPA